MRCARCLPQTQALGLWGPGREPARLNTYGRVWRGGGIAFSSYLYFVIPIMVFFAIDSPARWVLEVGQPESSNFSPLPASQAPVLDLTFQTFSRLL